MGKRFRRDRHRLNVPTSESQDTSSQSPRRPRSTPYTLPSYLRDCLTGVPLVEGRPTIVIPEYDPARPQGKRDGIPYDLHNRTPETGSASTDRLGSPQWTKSYRKYLREKEQLLPKAQREAEFAWRFWWLAADWVENELRANFASDEVDAVLEYKRDGADIRDVARRYGHTTVWIEQRERGMARHIRAYLPQLHRHVG